MSDQATQKWLILAATSLGAFMGSVMFTSVNVAMPSIMKSLGTDFNVTQWVVLAYLLATGTLLPIIGRLADMVGKKSLYLLGYAVFTVGSLLCGIAPSVVSLIIFRAIQGCGSAMLTALSMAIITDSFPATQRGRAIGINGSILSIGIVLGPTLGGLLADALSWRWIFLIAFPLGFLGFFMAQRFIPKYARAEGQRFDYLGAAMLFSMLLSLLLALTFGQSLGFRHGLIVALFVLSAGLLVIFIPFELRVKDPVLELKLFKNAQLSLGLMSGLATFSCIAGAAFLLPFYLENVLGHPTRTVGLLMSINPIILVITAPIAGSLADRFGEHQVSAMALLLMLLGYGLMTTLATTTTAFGYLLRFLPVALGMGLFQTPNNSAIMGSVPKSRSGVAGGLLALTRTLGSTIGIAVLGTIWAVQIISRSAGISNATSALPALQVAALDTIFRLMQALILLSLLVTIWYLVQKRLTGLNKHSTAPD